jgi:hypothetical protein
MTRFLSSFFLLALLCARANALENPCTYCRYAKHCKQCVHCPCTDKPNCDMCKYCPYCKLVGPLCGHVCGSTSAAKLSAAFSSLRSNFDNVWETLAPLFTPEDSSRVGNYLKHTAANVNRDGFSDDSIAADLERVRAKGHEL